jgi:hypothetical protein
MRAYRLSIPLYTPDWGRRRLALPHPKRGRSLLARLLLYFSTAVVLSVAGCATAPTDISVGARDLYHQIQLHRVLQLPVLAQAPFGLSDAEQAQVLDLYEAEAAAHLKELGLEVARQDTHDRAALLAELDLEDRALSEVFESQEGGLQDRRERLRALGESVHADAVWLGQVIYHSTATCDPTAESPYTPHVFVEGGSPQGPARVPCAISHFEARLLLTATGQTLWYNRALREVRASRHDAPTPDPAQNARDNVALVMASPYAGLPTPSARRD